MITTCFCLIWKDIISVEKKVEVMFARINCVRVDDPRAVVLPSQREVGGCGTGASTWGTHPHRSKKQFHGGDKGRPRGRALDRGSILSR